MIIDNQIVIQNSKKNGILWVAITNIMALPIGESEHGSLAPTNQISAINYHGQHW
jgi:hypothetical protein